METRYEHLRTIVKIFKVIAVLLIILAFLGMIISLLSFFDGFDNVIVALICGIAFFAEAEMILVFLSMEAGIQKITELLEGMQKEEK